MAFWKIIWTVMTCITVKCVLQCISMGENSDEELTRESAETPEWIYNTNIDPWKRPESGYFQLYCGGYNRDLFKVYRMNNDNTRFHTRWLSYQAFCITCYSTKGLTYMHAYTKKSTLSTDEISTNVIFYLDFYIQQPLDVIINTCSSYTCTPFKYDFGDMVDEAFPTKITGISKDVKI